MTPRRSFRFGFPRAACSHSAFLSVILLDLKHAGPCFEIASGQVRRRAPREIRIACTSFSLGRAGNRRSSEQPQPVRELSRARTNDPVPPTVSADIASVVKEDRLDFHACLSVRAHSCTHASNARTHARTLTASFARRYASSFVRTQVEPFARELRKAMQARATREPLVPSYVLTFITPLIPSLFVPFPPLPPLFAPARLSSSRSLNHTCPPSPSSFLTFTFLSPTPASSLPSLSPPPLAPPPPFQTRSFFIPIPPLRPYFFHPVSLFLFYPIVPSSSAFLASLLALSPLSLCRSPLAAQRLCRAFSLSARSVPLRLILRDPSSRVSSHHRPSVSHSFAYLAHFPSPIGHPQFFFSLSLCLPPFTPPFHRSIIFLSHFELRRSTFFFLPRHFHFGGILLLPFSFESDRASLFARQNVHAGGSTHHCLIHDYYHLICPRAFWSVHSRNTSTGRVVTYVVPGQSMDH